MEIVKYYNGNIKIIDGNIKSIRFTVYFFFFLTMWPLSGTIFEFRGWIVVFRCSYF